LADYQQHKAEFDALDTRIVAASADSEADTARLAERLGLTFTLGHGLDPHALARAVGCYEGSGEGHPINQPAGFVLDEAGRLVHAVYSSGKQGRLYAKDALEVIQDRSAVTRRTS
jgi:peroxiredoxin